ncbi:hypothetical protein PV10_00302 [Exophiala mesophila]|uniref:Hemerythrin-like domain-containing protein n=1 Tax=Exophiala mesophila TaxID=212818 RepID=A0A0D1X3N3_EXOME|nr:uncharacterized protein PV10_00302 [Exophiala mesophila]KIV96430.1 hypothetical protein PV10_00302 [Exophiala mesophila]
MAKPWADEPYPLITTPAARNVKASPGSIYVATGMALAHNVMIRYINSIYLQATGFSGVRDADAFLLYCRGLCPIIHNHHDSEEKSFFPMIEKLTNSPGIMDQSIQEHKDFENGFHTFEKYVIETAATEYDGNALRSILDDFAPPLLRHLNAEVLTLLSIGERFGGDKLQKLYDDCEAEIVKDTQAKSDPFIMLPAGFGAVDRTFESGIHGKWPPFPWFVPYLNKFIFYRRHSSSWRFSPCSNLKRRELQFVGDNWKGTKAFTEDWSMLGK